MIKKMSYFKLIIIEFFFGYFHIQFNFKKEYLHIKYKIGKKKSQLFFSNVY